MSKSAILFVFLVAAAFSLVGCYNAPYVVSIQIIPNAPSLTIAGQTVQFKAIATYQRPNHPDTTSDVTSQAVWASSEVSVSTINSSGIATAVGTGNTTITATMGSIVGQSSLTVSALAVHDLTSVTVIPGSQSVLTVGEPSQFIAIGTYTTAPMTLDLTNQVKWQSSDVKIATINSAGLALGNAMGTTTITAIGTSSSGAAVAGTSTLTVTPSGGVTLPQLSLYLVGLGRGSVTSSPVGINCSAVSAPGCTGNFVLGTPVVLTAVPAAGSTFGGWSSNCVPSNTPTCTVIMNNNQPVGAIFN